MVKLFKKKDGTFISVPTDNIMELYSLNGLFDQNPNKIPNNWFYNHKEGNIIVFDKTETGHLQLIRKDIIPLLDINAQKFYIKQQYSQLKQFNVFEYLEPATGEYKVLSVDDLEDITNEYEYIIDKIYKKIKIQLINAESNLFTIENGTWWNFNFQFDNDGVDVSGFVLNPNELYAQDYPILNNIIYDMSFKKSETSYWMVTVRYLKDKTPTFKTIPIQSPTYQYSIQQVFDLIGTNKIAIIYQHKFRNKSDYLKMFTITEEK